MNVFDRLLPWAVVTLAAIYLVVCAEARAPHDGDFDLEDFAALPVKYNGRVQPIDTVARNSLMVISGRQTFTEETGAEDEPIKTTQPAVRWLLDCVSDRATKHKVFRIENEQVLALLGLKPRPGSYRYSAAEIDPGLERLFDRATIAFSRKTPDLYDTKVMELWQHYKLYEEMGSNATILTGPPSEPGGKWTSYTTQFKKVITALHSGNRDAFGTPWMVILVESYRAGDIDQFNETLAGYRDWLKTELTHETKLAGHEAFFNRFAPFYHAILLYVFVVILAVLSWIVRPQAFFRAAFSLGVLTLLLHSGALVARMYLSGRPAPVFNLYSSAVFIGWGCVVLGLLLDCLYRNGIGCVIGAVAGALTLIIAHYLAISGDTLGVLEPVLNTNFWLATHVTCVTFGYTATFIAGLIGIAYVLITLFNPSPPRGLAEDLGRTMYGVVCFATLLSFTGTVLGGIWADQSWGRFWGWDPKENGALLIVIGNVVILHARWGGLIKTRGMAVLTILGNVTTAWAWFAVNMLGIGLHSYGRMDRGLPWLIAFMASQFLLAGLGMIDPAVVRSFFSGMFHRLTGSTMEAVVGRTP